MAYVIKSDLVVPDPSNRFPFLTRYGLAPRELSQYMTALEAEGFVLSQAAFTGFLTFIDTLKTAGVWSHLKEIYPLFGANASHAAIKLKADWAPAKMTAKNGLNDAAFEVVGGVVRGLAARVYLDANTPAFGTGVNAISVGKKWAFTAYADASGIDATQFSTKPSRALWGASLDDAAIAQTLAEVRLTSETEGMLSIGSGGGKVSSIAIAKPKGIMRFDAQLYPTLSNCWVNGNKYPVIAITADSGTVDRDEEIWLFAKKPHGVGTVSQGFNGPVRFAAVDDGQLTDAAYGAYRAAIDNLMLVLGKAFT